ncbi:MAG: hypothetical protein NC413_14195 [Muribaculum sp.]|nr:hypothetical protein [Muribaculum sp.]
MEKKKNRGCSSQIQERWGGGRGRGEFRGRAAVGCFLIVQGRRGQFTGRL